MKKVLLFFFLISSVLACKKEPNDKYIKPGTWTSAGEQYQYFDASGKLIFSYDTNESSEWLVTEKNITIRDVYNSTERTSSYQIKNKKGALKMIFKNASFIQHSECELVIPNSIADEMVLKGETTDPNYLMYTEKGKPSFAAKRTFRKSLSRKPDN